MVGFFFEDLLSHHPLRNTSANTDVGLGFWFWLGMSQCSIHYSSCVGINMWITYNFTAQADRFAQD